MARVFRYLYRVPLLLVHLLVFLPVTLLCLSPLLVWIRVGDENAGDVAVRWWSGRWTNCSSQLQRKTGMSRDARASIRCRGRNLPPPWRGLPTASTPFTRICCLKDCVFFIATTCPGERIMPECNRIFYQG